MKKLPIEERKLSTTIALSRDALEKLDKLQEHFYPGKSRSYALEDIIMETFRDWFSEYDDLIKEVDKIAEQTNKI